MSQIERCDLLRDGILRIIENFQRAFGHSDDVVYDTLAVLGFLGGSIAAGAPDEASLRRAHDILNASVQLGLVDTEARGHTKH